MSALNLAPLDRGVRLVYHSGSNTRYDEDPDLPYRILVNLRPPEFMQVTWIMLHGGSEEIIAQAETLDWAENFLVRNELGTHPRFRYLEITGPKGLKIERTDFGRHNAQKRTVDEADDRGRNTGWCVRCRRPVTSFGGGTGELGLCWANACDQRVVNAFENSSFDNDRWR